MPITFLGISLSSFSNHMHANALSFCYAKTTDPATWTYKQLNGVEITETDDCKIKFYNSRSTTFA